MHGFRCYYNIHVCKLIALYTVNAKSAEREISASACTRSVAGFVCDEKVSCSFVPPHLASDPGDATDYYGRPME